jgi:hypothetical protein
MNKELVKQLFDYRDGNLYWKNDNRAKKIKGLIAGYLKQDGYIGIRYMGKLYQAHRLVYLFHYGYLPEQIDHINTIKNDNRIENLRPCDSSNNHLNVSMISSNSSGHKNVTWHKKAKKWQVGFVLKGKFKHFGIYLDLELADLVAQEARNKYHKEFANHG